jgi:hypothetical protein
LDQQAIMAVDALRIAAEEYAIRFVSMVKPITWDDAITQSLMAATQSEDVRKQQRSQLIEQKKLPPHKDVLEIDTSRRIGACEVQVAARTNSGQLVVHLLHSKLCSGTWPTSQVLALRLQSMFAKLLIPRVGTVTKSFESEQLRVEEEQKNFQREQQRRQTLTIVAQRRRSTAHCGTKSLLRLFREKREREGGDTDTNQEAIVSEAFDFRHLVVQAARDNQTADQMNQQPSQAQVSTRPALVLESEAEESSSSDDNQPLNRLSPPPVLDGKGSELAEDSWVSTKERNETMKVEKPNPLSRHDDNDDEESSRRLAVRPHGTSAESATPVAASDIDIKSDHVQRSPSKHADHGTVSVARPVMTSREHVSMPEKGQLKPSTAIAPPPHLHQPVEVHGTDVHQTVPEQCVQSHVVVSEAAADATKLTGLVTEITPQESQTDEYADEGFDMMTPVVKSNSTMTGVNPDLGVHKAIEIAAPNSQVATHNAPAVVSQTFVQTGASADFLTRRASSAAVLEARARIMDMQSMLDEHSDVLPDSPHRKGEDSDDVWEGVAAEMGLEDQLSEVAI